MGNRSGSAPIILLLLVVAIFAGGSLYFYFTPVEPEPVKEVPSPAVSGEVGNQNIPTLIQSQWGTLSSSLTAALELGPVNGFWFIDGVQVISSNRAFVQFEDGHNAHIALIEYANGKFIVNKTFPSVLKIPLSEWNQIINQYGVADVYNYEINSAGQLVRTENNIILGLPLLYQTVVKIALLAGPAKDGDGERLQGCDLVVFKEIRVPATNMPLTAALKELFERREPWPYTESANGNYISKQPNLYFDKAVIENGVAKIYLAGSVVLGGVCDDPRLEVVIRNTAMQFSSVKSAEIYLNGQRYQPPSEM